jgi:hypothetical protein
MTDHFDETCSATERGLRWRYASNSPNPSDRGSEPVAGLGGHTETLGKRAANAASCGETLPWRT